MDRVLEARITAVQTRLAQLTAREQGLLRKLNAVRDEMAGARAEEQQVARAIAKANQPPSEEAWRAAVRRLGIFTVSEVAAELGVTSATAKRHMDMMAEADPPIVKPDGRLGKAPMYSYIKPTEAGAAFDIQKLRAVEVAEIVATSRPSSAPVPGTGSHPADVIAAAAVRRVVKKAIANGWRLQAKGDGHYSLRKGSAEVGVAGTPKNPTGAAAVIERMMRNAEQRMAA
jgi:hypothetical protein